MYGFQTRSAWLVLSKRSAESSMHDTRLCVCILYKAAREGEREYEFCCIEENRSEPQQVKRSPWGSTRGGGTSLGSGVTKIDDPRCSGRQLLPLHFGRANRNPNNAIFSPRTLEPTELCVLGWDSSAPPSTTSSVLYQLRGDGIRESLCRRNQLLRSMWVDLQPLVTNQQLLKPGAVLAWSTTGGNLEHDCVCRSSDVVRVMVWSRHSA